MKTPITIINKIKIAKKKYESSGFIILGFFGSYARNEAHEKSDVDLLYELSSDFREKYKGFKATTEKRIFCMPESKNIGTSGETYRGD